TACGNESCPVEIRPSGIRYTTTSTDPTYRKSVEFIYETRTDQEFTYVSSLGLLRSSRLSAIRIHGPMPVAGGGIADAVIRSYWLAYTYNSNISEDSRLTNIQECAAANQTNCKPALTFGYTDGSPTFDHIVDLSASENSFIINDFDGDGKDDILFRQGT